MKMRLLACLTKNVCTERQSLYIRLWWIMDELLTADL